MIATGLFIVSFLLLAILLPGCDCCNICWPCRPKPREATLTLHGYNESGSCAGFHATYIVPITPSEGFRGSMGAIGLQPDGIGAKCCAYRNNIFVVNNAETFGEDVTFGLLICVTTNGWHAPVGLRPRFVGHGIGVWLWADNAYVDLFEKQIDASTSPFTSIDCTTIGGPHILEHTFMNIFRNDIGCWTDGVMPTAELTIV